MIHSIAEKIINDPEHKYEIDEDQALALAKLDANRTIDLIYWAHKIQQHYKKTDVFKCAIINAKSGFCSQDCAFCAQSAHHQTEIKTYDLNDVDTLIQTGLKMAQAGATQYSMVTSGLALADNEIETVCQAARTLAAKTNLILCASLGILTADRARQLKAAGISRYHHNLETARSFFPHICTTHNYDDDIETIHLAQAAGMTVCSGGILGLGESWTQRVELALTLRNLNVDAVPLNFLNPIPGTRLGKHPLLLPMEALKGIALFRFILPRKDITICGGREKVLQDFQSWIFLAGANGLMIGNYLTTQGRRIQDDLIMIEQME